MHFPANPMAAILAHHAVAIGLGMALNRMADIPQARAGFDLANTGPHRLERLLHQAPRLGRDSADHVHLAGVGDKPAFFQGDVDIDDIAVLQHILGIWHAVAHHFIDGGVDAEGVVILPEAGGAGLQVLADKRLDGRIQFQGGLAGRDPAVEHREHLAQQAPGFAHHGDLCRGLDHQLRPRIRSGLSSNSLLIRSL